MVVCRGFGLYFHGQEVLAGVFSLFAGVLEKLFFSVLGPLVGPLCTVRYLNLFSSRLESNFLATFSFVGGHDGVKRRAEQGFPDPRYTRVKGVSFYYFTKFDHSATALQVFLIEIYY